MSVDTAWLFFLTRGAARIQSRPAQNGGLRTLIGSVPLQRAPAHRRPDNGLPGRIDDRAGRVRVLVAADGGRVVAQIGARPGRFGDPVVEAGRERVGGERAAIPDVRDGTTGAAVDGQVEAALVIRPGRRLLGDGDGALVGVGDGARPPIAVGDRDDGGVRGCPTWIV